MGNLCKNCEYSIWSLISDWGSNYAVSVDGRVRSLDRIIIHKNEKVFFNKGKVLVGNTKNSDGYCHIGISIGNKKKTESTHRAVAKAFVPNPCNKPEVNHLDGDKLNNHASNLEWVTRHENQRHAWDNGLKKAKKGVDNNKAKIKEGDVLKIFELKKNGYSQVEISRIIGIIQPTVSQILRRVTWRHVNIPSKLL